MNIVTESKRPVKRKIANKNRPIVNEDLSKFFPQVSRMGGISQAEWGWTNFSPLEQSKTINKVG